MCVLAYFLIVKIDGEVVGAYSVRNRSTEVYIESKAAKLDQEARDFITSEAGWNLFVHNGEEYFTVMADAEDLVTSKGNLSITFEYRTVEVI